MRIIDAAKCRTLNIGYAGEKDRTQVRFFFGDVQQEFPGGTVVLQVRRPGETTKYDVQLTTDEEGNAIWTVSNYDCAVKGFGECQLVYATSGEIAKRKIWTTCVDRSISGANATIPDTWQDIEAALLTAAAEARMRTQQLEAAEKALSIVKGAINISFCRRPRCF